MDAPAYALRSFPKRGVIAAVAILLTGRILLAVRDLEAGNPGPLLAYPFGAILPALLIVGLSISPPTRTREGLLMRFGAMVQLLLIIGFPQAALLLALGFPVVFLVVEMFETRVPKNIREPLARMVIA